MPPLSSLPLSRIFTLNDSKWIHVLSVWGQERIFSIIVMSVSRGVFLKGVDERFLLSEDERLTPNLDKGIAVNTISAMVVDIRPLNFVNRHYASYLK